MDTKRKSGRSVITRVMALFLLLSVLITSGCVPEDESANSGRLDLSLTADYTITAETRAATQATESGPSINDFRIQLYRGESESVYREWASYTELPSTLYLPENKYQLKASYGEQHKGAFEKPYYEGRSPFSIVKKQTTQVSVVCKIANVKVTVNYKEGFKQYFKDWNLKMASTGDSLLFSKNETRGAFFEPGRVGMMMTLTKQNGKSFSFEPPMILTEAGKHYAVNFDVTENGSGGANLVIRFDKTTEEKPIIIDISGDNPIFVAIPYIVPTGFVNNRPLSFVEGSSIGTISALINAKGKIKSCVLKTDSKELLLQGWPASINLADATVSTKVLTDKGFSFTSGVKGAQMIELDFSKLIPNLPSSIFSSLLHTFQVEVTDEVGNKNEPFAVLLQTTLPGFRLFPLENVDTSNGTAVITFEMISGEADKVVVEYRDDYGNWKVSTMTEKPKATTVRNVYTCKIKTDVKDQQLIRLNYNGGKRISNAEYLLGGTHMFTLITEQGAAEGLVTDPSVWATKAYLKVKDNVINPYKLSFKLEGKEEFLPVEIVENVIQVSNLHPGVKNTVIASVIGNSSTSTIHITTEKAEQLPNSNFSNWETESEISNITLGGRSVWAGLLNGVSYYESADKINITSRKPTGWCSTNQKTASPSGQNLNSWYIIPSCIKYQDNAICIRTVAWDYAGETVGDNTNPQRGVSVSAGATRGTPVMPKIRQKTVGELFLGTYSCVHDENTGGISSETYNEGINFTSRPIRIQGQYIYKSLKNEKGVIIAKIKDSNDTTLGECVLPLEKKGENYTTFTGDIKYTMNGKANKICIKFASSDKPEIELECEPNLDYNSNNQIKNKTFYANAITSTGSELYIDYIELIY